MSMPRRPLLNALVPAHNRLPPAGTALWWPLHRSTVSALDLVQSMDEILIGGAIPGTAWDTRGFYSFPTDNGNTNQVALNASHLDDDTDYLNNVLGLGTVTGGEELLVAMELSYVEQATTDGYILYYGMNNTKGGYGLYITDTEVLKFTARGTGGNASTVTTLTNSSGVAISAMKGQGRFALVMSIRMTGEMTGVVTVHIGHPTVGNGVYSGAGTWSAGGASKATDRNGELAANVMGFTVGARNTAASSHDSFWGRGGTNTGRIGNVAAKRYATTDGVRISDTLAVMLTHPLDIPRTFLD